ncbi:MAG TPA: DUF1583 domain-containing protein, partial [Pirellulales bacterium]|nr:DUF1583 domain-containing protein [Pirellulales bacterium]
MTLEQFGRAAEIAKLAAEHELHELSLRAVREALRPGPPAAASGGAFGRSTVGVVRRVVRPGQPSDESMAIVQVEARLAELDALWRRHGAPAESVYETLAEVVLPEARPAEILIYPQPIQGIDEPRSVGRLLARWAVDADSADDLKQRIEARQEQPLAQLPARVLLALLAAAAGDFDVVAEKVTWLEERLKTDGLASSAELACHAVPGLNFVERSSTALSLLESAAKGLAKQAEANPGDQRYGQLLLALARVRFKRGGADAGRKHLQEFLVSHERTNARYSGDYGVYLRKQQLQQVAMEFAKAGLLDDTLEALGRFADTPRTRTSDPPAGATHFLLAGLLGALQADERYERLKAWTMPSEERRLVRMVAGYVPRDMRPASFVGKGEGLLKSPAFAANPGAEISGTAWELVAAARECGKLDELSVLAYSAFEEKIENALPLWLVVSAAAGRTSEAAPRLQQFVDETRKMPLNAADPTQPSVWTIYVMAHTALAEEPWRALGGDLANLVLQNTYDRPLRNHVQTDLAASAAAKAGGTIKALGAGPGLAWWHPASHESALTHQGGSIAPLWFEYEGQVAHLTGPEYDFLYFDYPLTGRFEFSADVFEGGWGEGNLSYGGLVFEVLNLAANTKTQIWPVGKHEVFLRPDPIEAVAGFNRLSIQVEPGKIRCLCNGHLVYEDTDPSPTSPWLALYANAWTRTVYRHMALSGEPVVPRQVELTHADRLDGWISAFYGESQPPRHSIQTDRYGQIVQVAYDWRAQEGVIYGRRLETLTNEPRPSRLYYHRPLRDGETLEYDFLYEPESSIVHPALDRLAFLLAPEGVKLHWMVDEAEPNGLDIDNVVDEPDCRRGPKRLPLRRGEWNHVKLELEGGAVSIELNHVEICRRELEPSNDRLFGLFHYKDRSTAQVRNVVLAGDWPRQLAAEQLANLAQRREPRANAVAARVRAALVGEEFLCSDVRHVLAQSRTMPPAERYAYLKTWVLPCEDHAGFRLYGDFTPSDAAVPVAAGPHRSSLGDAPFLHAAVNRSHTGGTIEAPALELVSLAAEAGTLIELADEVERAPAEAAVDQRGKLAMMVLVRVAQERDDDAEKLLADLRARLPTVGPTALEWVRWPDLTAAVAANRRPKLLGASYALLLQIVLDHIQAGHQGFGEAWRRHLYDAAAAAFQGGQSGTDPHLHDWAPVSHDPPSALGLGMPPAIWNFHDGKLNHFGGREHDFLYFRVPLRGDFEVNAKLSGWREIQVAYAGVLVGLGWARTDYYVSHLGRQARRTDFVPPLAGVELEYDYRLVVQDDVYAAFVNGRKIHEQRLPAERDPWLVLYQPASHSGVARNLTITGEPTVPETLKLSTLTDLTGWLPYNPTAGPVAAAMANAGIYTSAPQGEYPAAWEKIGDEIRGERWGLPEGSFQESLLRYHRPMIEDGELEYEFFYEPAKTMVYPAMDRLVFLLGGDGVAIHWLTDSPYDRTGLSPDNATVEAANRRGPAALPLVPGEWNRMKLALAGDQVTLWLNEIEIFARSLEPT